VGLCRACVLVRRCRTSISSPILASLEAVPQRLAYDLAYSCGLFCFKVIRNAGIGATLIRGKSHPFRIQIFYSMTEGMFAGQ